MPKAILEFNLPEEQTEFEEAVKANEYVYALNAIDGMLRGFIKYDSYAKEWDDPKMAVKILQHIRDAITLECEERNITL